VNQEALEIADSLVRYVVFSGNQNLTAGRLREIVRELFGDELDELLHSRYLEQPDETAKTPRGTKG